MLCTATERSRVEAGYHTLEKNRRPHPYLGVGLQAKLGKELREWILYARRPVTSLHVDAVPGKGHGKGMTSPYHPLEGCVTTPKVK